MMAEKKDEEGSMSPNPLRMADTRMRLWVISPLKMIGREEPRSEKGMLESSSMLGVVKGETRTPKTRPDSVMTLHEGKKVRREEMYMVDEG